MTAKDWLNKAQMEGFAIPAFNVGNLETLKAVAVKAGEKRSPIIIESSPGETKHMGAENIVGIAKNFSEEFNIPILINLDHATSYEECQIGIEAGYEMIHFDGSALLIEENIKITNKLVEEAHAKDLLVEAEIDHIAGSSEVHKEDISIYEIKKGFTNPQVASTFVADTGVDIFASFFGNVHGVFPNQPPLDFELLEKIRDEIPCFLSLHGGSGISDEQIKEAIKIGRIVKININTELRAAFRDSLERVLAENKEEYALYKIIPEVLEAVQRVVEHKIDVFGSSGKADSI